MHRKWIRHDNATNHANHRLAYDLYGLTEKEIAILEGDAMGFEEIEQ
jgi:hypothetical protein